MYRQVFDEMSMYRCNVIESGSKVNKTGIMLVYSIHHVHSNTRHNYNYTYVSGLLNFVDQ